MFAILKYLIILSIFRRLRTYLSGIRIEMAYTYTGTYYVITGCFSTAGDIFISSQMAHFTQNIQQVAWAPCVTVLILSERTSSSCKATQTALSRTAPDIIILVSSPSPGVLALILSK